MLRLVWLLVLTACPLLLSAVNRTDTIIDTYKNDSLRFAIKADSIIAYQKGDSVFTLIKADTLLASHPEEKFHTRYDKRVHRMRKSWDKLIPEYGKIQYAGNMGLLSFGTGWDYGKRKQWETDLLFGFVPKYESKKAKVTMTTKQNYMPRSIDFGKGFSTLYQHRVWRPVLDERTRPLPQGLLRLLKQNENPPLPRPAAHLRHPGPTPVLDQGHHVLL